MGGTCRYDLHANSYALSTPYLSWISKYAWYIVSCQLIVSSNPSFIDFFWSPDVLQPTAEARSKDAGRSSRTQDMTHLAFIANFCKLWWFALKSPIQGICGELWWIGHLWQPMSCKPFSSMSNGWLTWRWLHIHTYIHTHTYILRERGQKRETTLNRWVLMALFAWQKNNEFWK